MLSALRRVQWKPSVLTRAVQPFRPYAITQKPGPAKQYPSPRTSRRKFPSISAFDILLIASLVILGVKQFDKITEVLFRPSYMPIGSAREIRLLVLEPGKAGDTISCSLKHVLLSEEPKYEALSYVWGKGPKGYIRVDGELVAIGEELFNALEALREPDRERTLWADALCINQGDIDERGQQVTIMGDIYASSQQVLIWFGKGTNKTADVFKSLKDMASDLKDHKLLAHSPEDAKEMFEFDWDSELKLPGSYFHRAWTLQEMMMAPSITIVHGEQSMLYGDYTRSKEHLLGNIEESIKDSIDMTTEKRPIRNHDLNLSDCQPKPYLEMVASNSPRRDATNPRDRIYAYRSISNDHDGSDKELFPDYGASVEEVYSRFARWCLVKNKDIAYLAHAGLPLQHEFAIRDVPSWVADWTRKKRPNMSNMLADNIHQYKAGSALDPSALWIPSYPGFLFIKGRVVDTVSELAVSMHDVDDYSGRVRSSKYRERKLPLWQKFAALLLGGKSWVHGCEEAQQAVFKYGMKGPLYMMAEVIWMEDCKAIATQGVNSFSPTRFDTFWRTMTTDRMLFSSQPVSRELGVRFQEYMHLLDAVRQGERWPFPFPDLGVLGQQHRETLTPNDREPTESELRARSAVYVYLAININRRFGSTIEGRLGFVPDCSKPGDLICVFDGADVPYVIRPKIDKPDKLSFAYSRRQLWDSSVETKPDMEYELVEECYIHGLMNGGALAFDNVKSEFIALC